MWSGQRGHAAAKAGRPAPRTPHQNDLRPIHLGGQPGGQGAVNPVVKARCQWGSGLVKAVNPLSQPLRARERRGRDSGCALTAVTEEAHRDREAPRPGVPRQRTPRASAGAPGLATWRRRALLAEGRAARAGSTLRRRAPRPDRWSWSSQPRARVREVQPLRGWTPRRCHHERSSRATAAFGSSSISRGARAVVSRSFFGRLRYPRLRLQEQNPPLNWRKL